MEKDVEHLPDDCRQELERLTAILLQEFDEAMRGKQASHRKAGRILKLIARLRPAVASDGLPALGSIHVLAVVNHRELADKDRHWHFAAARLRQEQAMGLICRSVQLDVYCLQDLNRELSDGVPYFTGIIDEGVLLFELERTPLATPRKLMLGERCRRGHAEFSRWYPRAEDFLSGAQFYRAEGNLRMAALLLHQTCEHLYQCMSWTFTLGGRRTHNLDELRALAEDKNDDLRTIWPRTNRFEKRCFALIRRAYTDARYETTFTVAHDEIAWALSRVTMLFSRVGALCREHLSVLQSVSVAEQTPSFCNGHHERAAPS